MPTGWLLALHWTGQSSNLGAALSALRESAEANQVAALQAYDTLKIPWRMNQQELAASSAAADC